MTLVEFLAARLDEDEAAVDVAGTFGQPGDMPDTPLQRWDYDQMLIGPARVLREVEAKQAILDYCEVADGGMHLTAVAEILATIWSDHPDYDPSWRP